MCTGLRFTDDQGNLEVCQMVLKDSFYPLEISLDVS